jgi:DNA modification methylase
MKTYYEHAGITIYHGNAIEIMPSIQADVMLTDPPYGMAYSSGWSGSTVRGDETTDIRDQVLQQWHPKPAIVFGRWSLLRPKGTRAVLIWDKGEWPGMGDLKFPWGPSHEEIYVIGEGFQGKRMGTVLRRDRIGGNGDHPTEKPISVLCKLIQRCPAGVIVDPFMGVGSTLVAANKEGRHAIGVELEEKYCEMAAIRLSQDVFTFTESA